MDKSIARTIGTVILFLLIAVSGSVFLSARNSGRNGDKGSTSADDMSQVALSQFEAELAEITNSITCAFHKEDRTQSYIIPYAHKALQDVENMTNDTLRLAVAWHLAREVLQLNMTNKNYHIRWQIIDSAVDSICYADKCLQIAGAPEMERCKFFFDALLRVKEGFLVTLADPPTKRTEMDRYGRGASWAQGNCKHRVRDYFTSIPSVLCNGEFRIKYPKLSPETQEYFKMRFREVFGIDYIPYEPRTKAHIYGEDGTRWDGKGLKWSICDEHNNWHDVP